MPAEVMEYWLKCQKPAKINGFCVRPLEHNQLKNTVLSIKRGQAEVFILVADDGCWWILKKFHQDRGLDRLYLESISSVLPQEEDS